MAEAPAPVTPITPVGPNAPTNPGAPAQAPLPAAARMIKLKLDGQDVELPESEVISRAQKSSGADKRFQEAAATRREAEQIIQFAKANPKEFFNKTGMNARQWAEEFLLGEIQRDAMTPEQKKAFENENELKKYRDQEKQTKEKAQQEQLQAMERQHMDTFDKTFTAALLESGLPKTAYTIKRMAELERVNLAKQLELTPSQLAKVVREDYINEQKLLMEAMDGDALLEMLGKEAVKKLSKAQLSKYKAAQTNNSVLPKSSEPKDQKKNPVQSWKEFSRKTRSLI